MRKKLLPMISLFAVALLGAVPAADAAFVQSALKSGNDEVNRAAVQANSTDYIVRQYAGKMTTDHQVANQALFAIATRKGIDTGAVPPQPRMNGTTPAPRPSPALSPIAYFRLEVRAHRQAIALFQKERASGGDADLRAYAAHNLPILRAHLQLAEKYLAVEEKRR